MTDFHDTDVATDLSHSADTSHNAAEGAVHHGPDLTQAPVTSSKAGLDTQRFQYIEIGDAERITPLPKAAWQAAAESEAVMVKKLSFANPRVLWGGAVIAATSSYLSQAAARHKDEQGEKSWTKKISPAALYSGAAAVVLAAIAMWNEPLMQRSVRQAVMAR